MNPETTDRLLGCAIGAAVGDALGMPLEFGPAIALPSLVREMRSGRLPAGSFTDDTEMALALAESLTTCGRFDGADLAARFLDWYHRSPPDIGNQTRMVLAWLDEGLDWQSASRAAAEKMPDSAGNGSLMRCWPAALAAWNDDAQLAEISRDQGALTHPHRDCTAACVFTNRAIAFLAAGKTPREAIRSAAERTSMSAGLAAAIHGAEQMRRDDLINSGWVVHTIQSAVWGLLNTTTFEDAVIQVANLGNDADTAASVAGALAGAAYGLQMIPSAWRTMLRGEWPLNSGRIWHEQDLLPLANNLILLAG